MLMQASQSILLIIDIQTKLLPAMRDPEAVVDRAGKLIDGAAILNIPVFVSEQYPKGIGPTDPTVLAQAQAAGAEVIEKVHFSCAGQEGFTETLQATGRSQVVIAGIEAHVCVLQTAMGLKAAGFDVFVAQDATSSRKDSDKQCATRRLIQSDIQLVTSEMVLFEWMGQAGTPAFKQISAFIK